MHIFYFIDVSKRATFPKGKHTPLLLGAVGMQIEIQSENSSVSGKDRNYMKTCLQFVLGRLSGSIGKASLLIQNVNKPGGHAGYRCQLEVALLPDGQSSVEVIGADIESTVNYAAKRMVRQLKRTLKNGPWH